MIFDWNKYLLLAKAFAGNSTSEYERCAISRAYYAVFNIACYKTNLKGRFDKHAALIKNFKELDFTVTSNLDFLEDEVLEQIGEELEYLRIRRNWADYETKDNTETDLVNTVIKKSENLINLLNNK